MKGRAILYTSEMADFIFKYQYGISREELSKRFNSKFNVRYNAGNLHAYCKRKGLKNGNTGQFQKGEKSHNKGITMSKSTYEKCAGTMFKKGVSINKLAIGSQRVSKDGYIEIKVDNPNKWMLKHKYIYEDTYGKIPKRHCIIFLDQNKQNCDVGNLKLIKRSQLLIMNRQHMFFEDKEINDTSSNLAGLIDRINEVKRWNA